MARSDRSRLSVAVLTGAIALLGAVAPARPEPLSPEMSPLGFLVGSWKAEQGRVEHGLPARGTFSIEPTAGGKAMFQRDHTQVLDPEGKPRQTFDQVTLIYPENGELHGDYFDGVHAIHYLDSVVEPGRSVRFTTGAPSAAPAFRLTYEKIGDRRLSIRFEMAPPGQSGFHPVAEGTAVKA